MANAVAGDAAGTVRIDIGGNLAPFEAALAKARQMADAFDSQVSAKLSGSSAGNAGMAKMAVAVEQGNAAVAKLTGTVTPAAAAISKLSTESTKASTAITGVGTSSAIASTKVDQLASKANNVAASIERAVAANQNFAASNLRMADGSAARASDIQAYGAALDDIRAKYNPLFRVTREYLTLKEELRIANRLGAISEVEAASALSRGRQETLAAIGALKGHTGALHETGRAATLSGAQIAELGHIVRAMSGTILAGGSAMQALAYEATRIQSVLTIGQGGIGGTLKALGGIAASTFSRITSLVAGSAILRSLGVAALAASVGFESIRDAASEAEHRSVGFGETFHAIFQTIGNDLSGTFIGTAFDKIASGAGYAFGKLGSAAVDVAELVINAFHAAAYDVVAGWKTFPAQLGLVFGEAANLAIVPINYLVKKSSDAVDEVIAAWNRLTGSEIKPINAPQEIIKGFDTSKLREQLTQALDDRNAAIDQIMAQHPLRAFASDVVGQIATNHALEGLDALGNIDFSQSVSGANSLGTAVGGIGAEAASASGQIMSVMQSITERNRLQLIGIEATSQQLRSLKNQAEEIQKTLTASGQTSSKTVFGDLVSGREGTAAIRDAVSSIDKIFHSMDRGGLSAIKAHDALELVRGSLKQIGGDPRSIDKWFDSIVNGEMKVRDLNKEVIALARNLKGLPNRADYPMPDGGNVGVTSFGGSAGLSRNPVSKIGGMDPNPFSGSSIPTSQLINVKDYLNSTATLRADVAKTQGVLGMLGDAVSGALSAVAEAARSAASKAGNTLSSVSTSADDSITHVLGVAATIDALHDKTVTITVRTINTGGAGGGASQPQSNQLASARAAGNSVFRASPLYNQAYQVPQSQIDAATAAMEGVTGFAARLEAQGRQSDNIIDARAAGGPVSAGSTYLVGEKGPEIVTMSGAGNVSTASATSNILTGGASVLKSIEENTFQTVEEVKRSVGYLETMEKDGQTGLSLLRAIKSAIGSSSINTASSGGGSSSGFSSGGGSSGSGSTAYSSNDPKSPYYFRNNAGRGPSGPVFDPLADYLLNGNKAMLGAVGQRLAGSPSNVDIGYDLIGGGGSQTWRQDFLAQLARTGPQTGSYGGGTNISADSDFISGANSFSGGFTGPGPNTRMRPGFATGGGIHPGDTQKVEAWKRPDEAVGFFRPEQMKAVRDAIEGAPDGGGVSKTLHMGGIHLHFPAGSQPLSKPSQMQISDRLRRVVREAIGEL